MNQKISDNDDIRDLKEKFFGVKLLSKFIPAIDNIIPEEFKEAQKQLDTFIKTLDTFNSKFGEQGWISHESANMPLLQNALKIESTLGIEKAEYYLAFHYTSSELKFYINRMKYNPIFNIRKHLIEEAFELTLLEKYDGAILLLLSIIDGAVNDSTKSKGFFAENTTISSNNSIAAHSTGLGFIKNIFNASRTKTNTSEIFVPYRNGILHGRDLNFGNKLVLGKCWQTLIAVNDWLISKEKKKNSPIKKEDKRSPLEVLKDYRDHKHEHNLIREHLDDWEARKISNIQKDSFKESSPEYSAMKILDCWKNKNYGTLVNMRYNFKEINIHSDAGMLRKELEEYELNLYTIIGIMDNSPAISTINVHSEIKIHEVDNVVEFQFEIRLVAQSIKDKVALRISQDLEWKYIDNFFHKLPLLKIQHMT